MDMDSINDQPYLVIINDVEDHRQISYTKHATYEAALEEMRQPPRNSKVIKYLTKILAARSGNEAILLAGVEGKAVTITTPSISPVAPPGVVTEAVVTPVAPAPVAATVVAVAPKPKPKPHADDWQKQLEKRFGEFGE